MSNEDVEKLLFDTQKNANENRKVILREGESLPFLFVFFKYTFIIFQEKMLLYNRIITKINEGGKRHVYLSVQC